MKDERPFSERIAEVLKASAIPLSIDDICRQVFGRIDERKRNVVRVNLHRFDKRGLIKKFPETYLWQE